MTSTPPPATIHTPPTPLHGPQYDSPPHLSLRKSSRLNKQSTSDRTPSPTATASFDSEPPDELKSTPKSRRSHARLSPPSSPVADDNMVATTRSAHKKQLGAQILAPEATSSHFPLGLPTPVKTPRKKPLAANSGAAARMLFPGQQRDNFEDQLGTPSKRMRRTKKHVGFSLDDEMDHENQRIEIYTDSKERIPEVDTNEDNPFYVRDNATRKVPKKRKRDHEIDAELDKGLQKLDKDVGMVYVFRGRKVYKRFDGPNPATKGDRNGSQSPLHAYGIGEEEELLDEDNEEEALASRRHFTRSSIKPKRLFNSETEERQHHGTTTDEEAVTDIEDPERHGLPAASASPSKARSSPRKPAPIQNAGRSFDAPASPFDSWPRRKSGRAVSSTKKREGETLQRETKRTR